MNYWADSLNQLLIIHNELKVFAEDFVMNYLSTCQKFLNIPLNGDKTALYYFKPLISEYFNQFEAYLDKDEYNFVLFIDSMVSKLELLVRKLCEINEISLIKSNRNGTTSIRLLHDLFNDEKFKELLFEKDYDFLKHILLQPGLNLRNKSAHGLDLNIYNLNNANALILCFFRLLKYFIVINGEFMKMQ